MVTMDFSSILEDADALLIVPPFASYIMPSIGVHTLQSCAMQQGIKVQVLNLNMAMAAELGEKAYLSCCMDGAAWDLIFAKTAYDTAFSIEAFLEEVQVFSYAVANRRILGLSSTDFQDVACRITVFYEKVDQWFEAIVREIFKRNYRVVGCSSTFSQTTASIALLSKIKQRNSKIISVMGGANCFGDMSEGILSLSESVDYVFSGESEKIFVDFMLQVKDGFLPGHPVIRPIPQEDLDLIPLPVYDDYFRQLEFFFDSKSIMKTSHMVTLPYETSRGCWWGEKKQCTFCGLNGETRKYREKSSAKTMEDLKELLGRYPTRKIGMVDNVMPQSYFRTFFPWIEKELPKIDIGYEIRAKVSLKDLQVLSRSGVTELQPGIESLSSSLLRRMDKGCLARDNIGFLRHTTALNLKTNWNILWGFPEDTEEEYIETLERVKVMKHLWPPCFCQMSIARFSKYFNNPGMYGISELRPASAESLYLPQAAKLEKLAANFTGCFNSYSLKTCRDKDNIINEIDSHIVSWRGFWQTSRQPVVRLEEISPDKFCIVDTRQFNGSRRSHFVDRNRALEVVGSRPIKIDDITPEIDWACENKLGLIVDHWYVSLITAKVELLLHFEELLKKAHLIDMSRK